MAIQFAADLDQLGAGGVQVAFGGFAFLARPAQFALHSRSANPIRGAARFQFAVPNEARVRVSVLDVQGREVAVLAEGTYPAGRYQAAWDGAGSRGRVAAGLYFVRYQAAGLKFVKRVVIAN